MNVGKLSVLTASLGMAKESAAAGKQMATHMRDGQNSELVLRGYKKAHIARSAEGVVANGTEAVRHARDAVEMLRRVDDPQFTELADGIELDAGKMAELVVKARSGKRKFGTDLNGVRYYLSHAKAMSGNVKTIERMIAEETEAQRKATAVVAKRPVDQQQVARLVIEADDARLAAQKGARSKSYWSTVEIRLKGVRGSKLEASRATYRENAGRAADTAREAAALLAVSDVPKHEGYAKTMSTAAKELGDSVDRAASGKVVNRTSTWPGAGMASIAQEMRHKSLLAEIDGSSPAVRAQRMDELDQVLADVDLLDAV